MLVWESSWPPTTTAGEWLPEPVQQENHASGWIASSWRQTFFHHKMATRHSVCCCVLCRLAAKVNNCWRLLDPVYALIM